MEYTDTRIIMHSEEALSALLPAGCSLFFIGIGGVSMSALAMIAKQQGYRVAGSDRARSQNTQMLEEAGIDVFGEHRAENITGFDAVIYNAAIHEDNPEYASAAAAGIPLIYRACFLTYLMRGYSRGIGVAGMHGKTTTSAMLSHLFLYADRDPAILIGAPIPALGRDFHAGSGDDFIFEACEYKDSFLSFRPSIAVVLNEEMDHPDYFKSLEQVKESFNRYMNIPGPSGFDVVNADDANVMDSVRGCAPTCVTFGITAPEADYRAVDITYPDGCAAFTVLRHGVPFCRVHLSVPGTHNVSNALACAAAADLCSIPADVIGAGLSSFAGASRRMEYKGQLRGTEKAVPVYDDFGHHPSEIRTTLQGARRMGMRRLRCVYQPHTYSRTAELFEEFVRAFDDCDEVYFADIYAARETNTYGISSADLAARIPHAHYTPDLEALAAHLAATAEEDDALIVMGAGDLAKFASGIVK